MIRVAVLGAGYFAKFHHDAWRRIDGAELTAVADADIAKAEACHSNAYGSLAAMLETGVPDVLDIVLPPTAHATAVAEALQAGIPLIICQKPFGTSPEEAARITAQAEAAGTRLVIHENFRFQPWYRRMREIIDGGDLGETMQISFRLRTGDGQGPKAYLDRQPYFQTMPRFLVRETGVHWIDTFRYLMGQPKSVIADLRQLNPAISGEDAGYILMDHGDGRRSLFDGNRHLDHSAENLRLTLGEALLEGTQGTVTLNGYGEVHLRRFGRTDPETVLARQNWPGFAGDCVRALNAHVVAHLRDGAPLENGARDYLEVARIEAAVYRSQDTGQRVSLS